ncbi:hypothetical protein [Burkholderia phage BCSR5]|nr:hypothetical protein [Burkholderia phage BCSR5]
MSKKKKKGPPIKRGVFCGIIKRQLLVATCPLPKGSCVWKHRVTGQCKYTEADLTPVQYAELVGAKMPDHSELVQVRQIVFTEVKKEFQK